LECGLIPSGYLRKRKESKNLGQKDNKLILCSLIWAKEEITKIFRDIVK